MIKILTRGKDFVDSYGRQRIFNGINMVYKGESIGDTREKNYIPNWDESHFKWLKDNGFNIIRLGIVWDAIEHEMGKYDEKYLDWVSSMLQLCEKYNIYAFLDMHQDLYGIPYGGGAPEWAFMAPNKNHMEGAIWSDAYILSEAINTAYYNFWLNTKAPDGIGLQDHYANMWAHIVERLKDHKALIGYDVLNEPFPGKHSQEIFGTLLGAYAQVTNQDMTPQELMEAFGDIDKKKDLLKKIDDIELYAAMAEPAFDYIEAFDNTFLAPFYKKMTAAIRQVNEDGIMMMENCYFSNMGVQCSIPLIENNGVVDSNQAFTPHGYDLVVDTPYIVEASNNRITAIFNNHKNLQDKLNIPVVVGEWGAHSMYAEGLYHIKYLLNYFDQQKWSQTYWCYHENIEQAPVMSVLKRPYPQAVSGDISNYKYDYEEKIFDMEWNENSDSEMPTSIYLPCEPKDIKIEGQYSISNISDISDACILTIPNSNKPCRKLQIIL